MPATPVSLSSNAAATSHWGSLKLRLALIGALLIAASVALTVGLTLRAIDRHSEQVALDLSLAQTRKMAKLISARLVSLQLSLRAAAARLDTRRPIEADAALTFLGERAVLVGQFDSLFVSRPDGRVLALRDDQGVRSPTLSVGDREYFRQTLAQQRPIISPPIVGPASSEPTVVLTMPVRGEDGRIVAVLAGSMRLATRDLMPEITAVDEDDPASTVIVDAQGRVLSHPNRQWLMRDAPLEPTLAGAVARWRAGRRRAARSNRAGWRRASTPTWCRWPACPTPNGSSFAAPRSTVCSAASSRRSSTRWRWARRSHSAAARCCWRSRS